MKAILPVLMTISLAYTAGAQTHDENCVQITPRIQQNPDGTVTLNDFDTIGSSNINISNISTTFGGVNSSGGTVSPPVITTPIDPSDPANSTAICFTFDLSEIDSIVLPTFSGLGDCQTICYDYSITFNTKSDVTLVPTTCVYPCGFPKDGTGEGGTGIFVDETTSDPTGDGRPVDGEPCDPYVLAADKGEDGRPTNTWTGVDGEGYQIVKWDSEEKVEGTVTICIDNIIVCQCPEPSSTLMLGLGAFGFIMRRKK